MDKKQLEELAFAKEHAIAHGIVGKMSDYINQCKKDGIGFSAAFVNLFTVAFALQAFEHTRARESFDHSSNQLTAHIAMAAEMVINKMSEDLK